MKSEPLTLEEVYLPHGAPVFTKRGTRDGFISALPYGLGMIAFGLTAGVLAAQTRLSLPEGVFMNSGVYVGAAQLAAYAHWPAVWTLANILAVLLIVVIINSRFILMGASLYPYFKYLKGWQAWALLFFNIDILWLMFLREAETAKEQARPPDIGFYFGFGVCMWMFSFISFAPGWWIGSAITDFKRYGLDLFMLMFFASISVPLWKGVAHARPWMAAAVVAAIAYFILPGSYYIVIGALAGSLTGALQKT
ncbi:MAG: AzlC family ABC transporter permease [Pseudomonadota bacterium]